MFHTYIGAVESAIFNVYDHVVVHIVIQYGIVLWTIYMYLFTNLKSTRQAKALLAFESYNFTYDFNYWLLHLPSIFIFKLKIIYLL